MMNRTATSRALALLVALAMFALAAPAAADNPMEHEKDGSLFATVVDVIAFPFVVVDRVVVRPLGWLADKAKQEGSKVPGFGPTEGPSGFTRD